MDDDDPDALEAFIIYLHMLSMIHIEYWNIQCPLCHEEDHDCDDGCLGELLEGYLPFLAEVYRIADKYLNPALTEAISDLVHYPEMNRICQWEKWLLLKSYYENYLINALKALSLLLGMPDSFARNRTVTMVTSGIIEHDLAEPERHEYPVATV